jgi:simple sugar transport system ATP-binding protein
MEVTLTNIRKYFGPVKANDGISFTLEAGKVYGLLGENGAGKSTLMKILSGYQPQDSGEILLDGVSSSFNSPAQALANGIGMIYQDPHDVPSMRVLDNYLLGRSTGVGLEREVGKQELLTTAKRMGFPIDLKAYVDTLSLGERQQLELLRLLAMGAGVLILDEPTTGISAEQKEELFDSIRKLTTEEGKTVILVSHKLSEVQELCQHVMVLRRGKLVGESDIPCPLEKLVGMMFEEIPPRQDRESFVKDDISLELKDVSIESDRVTAHNLNLAIKVGEVFGLAGLEGGGQRLMLQACSGLMHPSTGQIILDGEDITRKHYHKLLNSGMAYLAAGRLEEGLVAGLSLLEHVTLADPDPGFVIDRNHFDEITRERIDKYQIVGVPNTMIDALSGGNQQRALFALLRSPLKLLLLEHPTRGLDVRSADYIWQLLFERVKEGMSIVFMSADLDELVDRSDRIAAFSGGRMSRVVNAAETSIDELGHLIGGEQ